MRYILVMIIVWLFIKQTSAEQTARHPLTQQRDFKSDPFYRYLLQPFNQLNGAALVGKQYSCWYA